MAIVKNLLAGTLTKRLGKYYGRASVSASGERQTVLASRPSNNNPRTTFQMQHRARFANAVKFYKKAVANYFRFAYENKRPNESDYNAFMRKNIDRSAYLKKSVVDDPFFPALGRWLMTEGSLQNLFGFSWNSGSVCDYNPQLGEFTNVGDFSQLLESQGYQEGDVVTIVAVTSQANSLDFDFAGLDSAQPPQWLIWQFKLAKDSTLDFSDIPHYGISSVAVLGIPDFSNGNTGFRLTFANDDYANFACLTISRVISNSEVKVTTSYLEANETASKMINSSLNGSDEYMMGVADSWGAGQSDAILKGSIADGGTGSGINAVVITSVNGSTGFPLTEAATTAAKTVTIVGENLPQKNPVYSGTGSVLLSATKLNSDKTQATFTFKQGTNSNGSYSGSISYAGIKVITTSFDVEGEV